MRYIMTVLTIMLVAELCFAASEKTYVVFESPPDQDSLSTVMSEKDNGRVIQFTEELEAWVLIKPKNWIRGWVVADSKYFVVEDRADTLAVRFVQHNETWYPVANTTIFITSEEKIPPETIISGIYEVQEGDCWSRIAYRFDVPIDTLISWNQHVNGLRYSDIERRDFGDVIFVRHVPPEYHLNPFWWRVLAGAPFEGDTAQAFELLDLPAEVEDKAYDRYLSGSYKVVSVPRGTHYQEMLYSRGKEINVFCLWWLPERYPDRPAYRVEVDYQGDRYNVDYFDKFLDQTNCGNWCWDANPLHSESKLGEEPQVAETDSIPEEIPVEVHSPPCDTIVTPKWELTAYGGYAENPFMEGIIGGGEFSHRFWTKNRRRHSLHWQLVVDFNTGDTWNDWHWGTIEPFLSLQYRRKSCCCEFRQALMAGPRIYAFEDDTGRDGEIRGASIRSKTKFGTWCIRGWQHILPLEPEINLDVKYTFVFEEFIAAGDAKVKLLSIDWPRGPRFLEIIGGIYAGYDKTVQSRNYEFKEVAPMAEVRLFNGFITAFGRYQWDTEAVAYQGDEEVILSSESYAWGVAINLLKINGGD